MSRPADGGGGSGPPDLVIDYSLLHRLAGNMKTLRTNVESDLRMSGGMTVASEAGPVSTGHVGDSYLYGALLAFYRATQGPFSDALDALDQLSNLFGGIADAYFNVDADLKSSGLDTLAQMAGGDWQSQKAAYDDYLKRKADGTWPDDQPPPPKPADNPSGTPAPGTQVTYDDQGRVLTQTTTVTTSDGQSYTKTVTYDYGDGKTSPEYSATVTYAGGETMTLNKHNNADGSYTVTSVTDGKTSTSTVMPVGTDGSYSQRDVNPDGAVTSTVVGNDGFGSFMKVVTNPDGSMDIYTGDPNTNSWSQPAHVDPPTPAPADSDPNLQWTGP
ncbi:hypothetical protein [Pseudofrankia sp. BMG5.36]|uniref:hypothetical protein n=1 Tax=Pseudofrankia sp. BMG5.36 TaxID=1834512 RepID=UPI0008DAEF64|nr:hypothetical protein [Pseudofrankia sp. BMG5.36]OHV60562.1 hypothetical protein BCD48_05350 [Pseudofrankia sp. BMG5.36]